MFVTRRGSNPQLPDHQSNVYPTKPPRTVVIGLNTSSSNSSRGSSSCCRSSRSRRSSKSRSNSILIVLGLIVLIALGFNDTSTLVGHFVSSPREREKRDRRDSRGYESEEHGRKRNRNESEETEKIKTPPSTLTLQG